jgi:hypothetical protein
MMLGSFVRSLDIQYRGSLEGGIFFDEEEFLGALRTLVKLHYRHGALYSALGGDGFGSRLGRLIDVRALDDKTFAEDLGVSLDYVQVMKVEPLSISNPSARLLQRMSVLLGESVGFLLGEEEQDDAIYKESKESFIAWVRESDETVDARTAQEVFDVWKSQYFALKVENSPVSFRAETPPKGKADWDEMFQRAKACGPASRQRSMFAD